MAIADDGGYTGETSYFLGSALSVAAGDDDAGAGIEAVSAPDVSASFAVGLGGNAAGVDDNRFGFGLLSFGGARVSQERRDGFAIGAGGAATKVLDVEGRGHSVSLVELGG